MSAKTRTMWTFAITSVAVFMATLDNLVVTTALPVIREDLHATHREPRVDGQRVHAHVRGAAPHRSRARRPVRATPDARDRSRDLHRLVGGSCACADCRCTDRSACGSGCGRRDHHAVDADDPERGRAGQSPRRLHRRLERHRRPGCRARPGRRRRRRERYLLALDLLAQRSDRHRPDPACAPASERVARAGGQARPAGRGACKRRSDRHRVGTRPRQRPGLGIDRDRRGARGRRDRVRALHPLGASRATSRCCRCASSGTAPSRSRTSRHCSCSSGCSARSSC